MKYIKRKSAVKPITGSIVDTTNIDDTTSNTYSANVIDGLFGEWEKVNFVSTTDYLDMERSSLLVNKKLKLARVQINIAKAVAQGTTTLANIPSEYAPNRSLMGDDSCWFIVWYSNGELKEAINFGRGKVSPTGSVTVLTAFGAAINLYGYIIYPYA
jgi:hypothetical protein